MPNHCEYCGVEHDPLANNEQSVYYVGDSDGMAYMCERCIRRDERVG